MSALPTSPYQCQIWKNKFFFIPAVSGDNLTSGSVGRREQRTGKWRTGIEINLSVLEGFTLIMSTACQE